MKKLNKIMDSRAFATFLAANKAGQLSSATLYAIAQVLDGKTNTQQLNNLLRLEMFRKANGDLNVRGVELRDYISHFKLPQLQWQGDKNRFQFISAEPVIVNGKVEQLDVFTALTFTEWLKEKDSKPKGSPASEKPINAKALLNNFKKLADNGLTGKPDEMAELLAAIDEAKENILKGIAAAKSEQIDVDAVLMAAAVKPTASSKAAKQKKVA